MKTKGLKPFLIGMACLLAAPLVQAEPSADDKESARALLKEGDAKFAAKAYEEALKAYEAADDIMKVPTTGVEVARAQEALGRLVEARDTCLRVAHIPSRSDEPQAFGTARRSCEERVKAIEPKLALVRVVVTGGVADVTIDGRPIPAAAIGLPRRTNPGTHTVSATASGKTPVTREVLLTGGESSTVTLDVSAAEPAGTGTTPEPIAAPTPVKEPSGDAPRTRLPTYAWIGFGVGAVGLATGTITGLISLGGTSSAKDQCFGNVCPKSAQSDIDSASTFANVANVAFAIGLVGLGVGVVGLLTAPSAAPKAALQRRLAPFLGPVSGVCADF